MERTTHVPFFALIILALFFLLGGFDAIAQQRIAPADQQCVGFVSIER